MTDQKTATDLLKYPAVAGCADLAIEYAKLFAQQSDALALIADIAEGSTTANSLPNIAKIARKALEA